MPDTVPGDSVECGLEIDDEFLIPPGPVVATSVRSDHLCDLALLVVSSLGLVFDPGMRRQSSAKNSGDEG